MSVKNKYKVERNYITNRKARSRQKLNGPRFLVAHETANNSTGADGHRRYFQNINFSASAHTFIDDKKILEIIPTDEKAWHVQYNQDKRTLGLGYANDNAVGPELCRPGNFEKAYDRYVWYFAYLCHEHGLKPGQHITAHKFEDPQRRLDPQSWLEPNGVSWNQFINDVQNYYDNWESDDVSAPSQPSTGVKWIGTNDKGKELIVDTESLNYYDTQRWTNPTGSRKRGFVWKIDNLYEVNGSLQYRVQDRNGNLFYTSGRSDLVKIGRLYTKSPVSNTPVTPPKSGYTGSSIVEYLNSIEVDSSFDNRRRLAQTYGISNYTGTAAQNTRLLNLMRGGSAPKHPKRGNQTTTSIVDYLNSINVDSSFSNRQKLARQHGISNYRGTAAQNSQLLKKIRGH